MGRLPPIHVLNLDRSVERLRLFTERNAHLKGVVRVSATDGSTVDGDELVRLGLIAPDLRYGPGALGCALSHIGLWKTAASRNESITIFEDDTVVSNQFVGRAEQVLSMVPDDWDVIQWGYVLDPLFVWVDLGISKVRLEGYGGRRHRGPDGASEFQAGNFPVAPVRLLHSFGLQAYSISAKGAQAALDRCVPLRERLIPFPDAGSELPTWASMSHCAARTPR